MTAAFLVLADAAAGERVAMAAHDAINQAVLGQLFPGRWPGTHAIPQRNGCWNNVELALIGRGPSWVLHVLDAVPGDGILP